MSNSSGKLISMRRLSNIELARQRLHQPSVVRFSRSGHQPPVQPPSHPPGQKLNAQMRFRTDGWNWADQDRAQPGDTWRIFWAHREEETPKLAGYAICCPRCKRIHAWTTANNCHWNETDHSYTDQEGKIHTYKLCGHHSGHSSCWQWSGDAENNKLTAKPSLFATSPYCGWHGFLTDGFLREC